jgi:hypothetical protein
MTMPDDAEAQARESVGQKRDSLLVRVIGLALALNLVAWAGAGWVPDAQAIWPWVSLVGCFVLGFIIGRPWALLVTVAFSVIHAIPVYLGLLPGYLSTWEEALWWMFAAVILLVLTGLGVLLRGMFRRLQRRNQDS